MGSAFSSQNGKVNNSHTAGPRARKLQGNSTDPFTQFRKLSWFPAGEATSSSIMAYTGCVWCDSSNDSCSRLDTFQNVTEKTGRSMLKEKLHQLSRKNSGASSNARAEQDRDSIEFYGYSFQDGREITKAESRLNLSEHREILGVANLQGALAWYPIGKNFIESPDEEGSPCVVFAHPEYVIVRLTVDNEEVGITRCPGSGPPCFLSLPVKGNSDLIKSKKLPIYLTRTDRMNIGQPEPYSSACTEGFNDVFRGLSPGIHHCYMTLQFAYKTSKVTAVSCKQSAPSSSPRLNSNHPNGKGIFDLSSMHSVRNSSLALRHNNPSKFLTSPALCSGKFSIVLPESGTPETFECGSFQSFNSSFGGYQLDSPPLKDKLKKKNHKTKRRRFSSG